MKYLYINEIFGVDKTSHVTCNLDIKEILEGSLIVIFISQKIQSIVCCIICRIFFNTMARIFLVVRLVTKEISVPYIDFNENVRSMYNTNFWFLVYISTSYRTIVNFIREFNKTLDFMTEIIA